MDHPVTSPLTQQNPPAQSQGHAAHGRSIPGPLYITTRHSTTFLPDKNHAAKPGRESLLLPILFLPGCACHSYTDAEGWHYDWELTKWTCLHDLKDTANYDSGSGRCIANPHARIDGQRFQDDCIQRGVKDGYRRYNDDGTVDYRGYPLKVGGAYSICPV
ncbi:hypothetical protein E4U41_007278 [Claviceps citrina]|nr:hypothetical protein E4U41_007278 [Claviceps citrina]